MQVNFLRCTFVKNRIIFMFHRKSLSNLAVFPSKYTLKTAIFQFKVLWGSGFKRSSSGDTNDFQGLAKFALVCL